MVNKQVVRSLDEIKGLFNDDDIFVRGVPTDIASVDFITFYINDIPLYYAKCGSYEKGAETTRLLRSNRLNKEIEASISKETQEKTKFYSICDFINYEPDTK